MSDQPVILFVDDDALSCKWFSRTFVDEGYILTATSVNEALNLLRTPGRDVAVLVTDQRMPDRTGLDLLREVQHEFRHLVRLLATAYAEKDVAIAAVNEGQVFRILEKPLGESQTRIALREALSLYATQARQRILNEQRVRAMRETLGFLAHELNTPLTTIRGYMTALTDRYQAHRADTPAGHVLFREDDPGQIMSVIASVERRALYCQSLVSTFVQSARDAYPGSRSNSITAGSLVQALLDEFPFEGDERAWVSCNLSADFALPGQRDLLYLVLCTLTKNALWALRETPGPSLHIELGEEPQARGAPKPWMRFIDNGPGIAPEVLSKLTIEPVTTRAEHGGNGMGLLFCRRVVQSLAGSIAISSKVGQGTTVSLYFQPYSEDPPSVAG
ncbi:MAG: hybrid sensor histidine kinase/response regulator [Burkholderiaceae bacterium]|nr:hybrid sensor histidine kinase/response regulator [Burkholderiaceae bacterium]